MSTDPDHARATAERDQLWASLRPLRPHIDRLAAGDPDSSPVQAQIAVLLARIVAAELDYRERDAGGESDPPAAVGGL